MDPFEFLAGLILWPLLTLIFGPFVLILFIIRVIVNFIAKSHSLTPVPHGEQLYTCPDGEIWALLTGAIKLQSKVNLDELRKLFAEKFLQNPKESIFYKEVVHFLGYGFTRPVKKIDLNFHIREIEAEQGEGFNHILTKTWMDNSAIEQKKGRGIPPWEILVCNNIQGEKGSMISIKIHHCLADGYSLVTIIDTLTGNKSPYIVKPWAILPWRRFKIIFNLPLGLLKQIYNLDVGLVKHPFNLNTAEEIAKEIPLIASTVTLDFGKFKEIRKFVGCRMLPVFLCVHVEAVKQFLEATGRVEEGAKYEEYFRHIVNLPKPEHPAVRENKFCNHMIMGDGKVPLNEPDLLRRLQKTNADFESFEENDEEKIAAILAPIPYLFPTWIIRHFQDISKWPMFSTISTLILSPDQYFLQGQKIVNLYFGTTFDTKYSGMRGVTLFTFTRGNEVDACVVASKDLFRSQAEIDHYSEKFMVEALDDYWKLCGNKGEKK